MQRQVGLLLAGRWHARPDLGQEPGPKGLVGLHRSAPDHEGVGIEDVDHLVEEQPQGPGLDPEDLPAHAVAPGGQAPHLLGGGGDVGLGGERMVGVPAQKMRQQRPPDRRQRAERLEVAGAAAIALGHEPLQAGDLLPGDQHVPQLAAEAVAAGHDPARGDHAPAQAGADDGRHARRAVLGAEQRDMAPEGCRIAVIEVGDGDAQPGLEPRADVEAGPLGMDEVGGAAAAEHAAGAGRAGRVEAGGHEFVEAHTGSLGGRRQPGGDLVEADGGPFDAPGRVLAEAVDQELPPLVEKRVVDRRPAQVDPGDDFFRW